MKVFFTKNNVVFLGNVRFANMSTGMTPLGSIRTYSENNRDPIQIR